MYHLNVFRAEREAGLEETIRSTASVKSIATLRVANKFEVPERTLAGLRHASKASTTDFDLHYLDTILATTGWNGNDDVFDRIEMWMARATAEDKPVNYEHNETDIVGHLTSSKAVADPDLTEIAGDTLIDDLPAKFHILTGAVLYKVWSDEKLQERMLNIISEIAKNEWAVSMECLFRGFDYALKSDDGVCQVVARTETTAFLTKHLRAYGGTGVYGPYKLGRILRNFVFSGKGLTRTPANSESVILNTTEPFVVTSTASLPKDLLSISVAEVYSPVDAQASLDSQMEISIVDNTELQKQLESLRTENEQLKASAKESDLKGLKQTNEALAADLKVAREQVAALTESKSVAEATLIKAQADLTEATKSLTEVRDELKNIYAEQKKADRLAKLKAAIKAEDDVVAAIAESLSTLNDEQFSAYLASQAKVAVAVATAEAKPEAPAKPVADQATQATAATLDSVTPTPAPALVVPATSETEVLAKQIASFCGDE